ncbi:MAG: DUF1015 domain-containing protein [Saprospiraceae bacterium]|nr:DUF1015 domain-containing protein [Saprospiraceae bacterium]
MRIKPFATKYPNFKYVASPDSFCSDMKDDYREFVKSGFFENADQEALYIYEIESGSRKHIGFVGLTDVGDYNNGKIKKHEETLSEKEQQQLQLFLRWQAVLKPVLLTFPPVNGLNEKLINLSSRLPLLFETYFQKDKQTHRIWAVTDTNDINEIIAMMRRDVDAAYIADGHHRTTTMALMNERLKEDHPEFDFSQLFCAYFASDQLDIRDYNRVVEGLQEISPARFMASLSQLFDIAPLEKPGKPEVKHDVVLFLQDDWYRLRWKKEVLDAYPDDRPSLDATLLNERVLRDILGIRDVRNDLRIVYVEGTKGLSGVRKAVHVNEHRVGFLLYPVSISDLMDTADAGDILPPKSTFFEPRLKSGLLIRPFRKS